MYLSNSKSVLNSRLLLPEEVGTPVCPLLVGTPVCKFHPIFAVSIALFEQGLLHGRDFERPPS